MRIRYEVLSAVAELIPMTVRLGDRDVQVQAPGVTIDVRSVDGSMCHTLRFLEDEAPDIDELQPGMILIAGFQIEEE